VARAVAAKTGAEPVGWLSWNSDLVVVPADLTAAGRRILATTSGTPSGNNSPTLVLGVTESYLPAEAAFQQKLAQADTTALPSAELTASFAQVTFTSNLQETAIRTEAQQAVTAGLIKPVTNWTAIFDN
jgi:hypothetical protein